MTDFLLELRSEEIPARMQARAREDLARLIAAELAKAGLAATDTITYATPRRLALIARGLPYTTPAVSEETKGPRASAPPQALEGFLRKTGLARDQLVERHGVLFAVVERPGRPTADVLAEAIPAVIRAFPWPKSMRWGAASTSMESLRWVRPLQGIAALLGEEIVPVEIAGITSGAATLGHRFHHPGPITIGSAGDYAAKLRACHVIVDPEERGTLIRERAGELAAEAGLELIPDEGLVAENAGLTEWPVPLLGRFDPAFLAVPPEVIQLTARVNQKYFVCRDAGGALANAFVCTANIEAIDGGAAIVEGNRKVLAARLSDARFFYETDLKVPLEDQATKLDRIVFHEKLGTVSDKVERVVKLARWLVEEGVVQSSLSLLGEGDHAQHGGGARSEAKGASSPSTTSFAGGPPPRDKLGEDREELANLAERAARLCKADLVTGMVGEFPELQGVMGGYYAAAQGEDPRVAAAIRDHYKPVGQGDEVPTAPVTVAVSLADKLDTVLSFFHEELLPSGSKDPFALRRQALAVLALVTANSLRLRLEPLLISEGITGALYRAGFNYGIVRGQYEQAAESAGEKARGMPDDPLDDEKVRADFETLREGLLARSESVAREVLAFLADRLKVQQREAGVRHDLIDAVFALGGEDDLVRLLARVRALQAFVTTADGVNLLAGYKRAANILKKEGWASSPLPVGEGQGASAPRGEGEGERSASSPSPSRSAAPSGPLPLPMGEGAEAALVAALDAAEPAAAAAIAREDFEGAMTALASLRAPIDAFFEQVTVNDPDPATRAGRLALLARVRDAVHAVADFSRIEG
ncbi:glycine--tRNA ligase subunit beta [uncultured Sphingomonas sp.]|uniref:glycine--tRNA ligase subunit beta n=1 Tax=uncultured Sphingomonas sp. TaxID=158754 RepID=UPI0035CC7380